MAIFSRSFEPWVLPPPIVSNSNHYCPLWGITICLALQSNALFPKPPTFFHVFFALPCILLLFHGFTQDNRLVFCWQKEALHTHFLVEESEGLKTFSLFLKKISRSSWRFHQKAVTLQVETNNTKNQGHEKDCFYPICTAVVHRRYGTGADGSQLQYPQ